MALRDALQKPIIERMRPGAARTMGARVRLGATTLVDLLVPDGVDRRSHHMIQAVTGLAQRTESRA
jgi:hypothetical protein